MNWLKYLPGVTRARRMLRNPSWYGKWAEICGWYLFGVLIGTFLFFITDNKSASITLSVIFIIYWSLVVYRAFVDNLEEQGKQDEDIVSRWVAAYKSFAIGFLQEHSPMKPQKNMENNIKDWAIREYGREFTEELFRLFRNEIVKDYFFYASQGIWLFFDLLKQKKIKPDLRGLKIPD